MNLVLMWSHVYLVPFLYCFLLPTIPHLRFLLPFAAEHNVEGSMEKEIRPWLLRETIPLQVGGSDWKRRDRWSDRFTALSLSLEVQLLTHHSWPMMLELCSKPLLFDDNGVALPNIYIYIQNYLWWESPSTSITSWSNIRWTLWGDREPTTGANWWCFTRRFLGVLIWSNIQSDTVAVLL